MVERKIVPFFNVSWEDISFFITTRNWLQHIVPQSTHRRFVVCTHTHVSRSPLYVCCVTAVCVCDACDKNVEKSYSATLGTDDRLLDYKLSSSINGWLTRPQVYKGADNSTCRAISMSGELANYIVELFQRTSCLNRWVVLSRIRHSLIIEGRPRHQ